MSIGLLQLLFKGYNFSDLVKLIHVNTVGNNDVLSQIVEQALLALSKSSDPDSETSAGLLAMVLIPSIKAIMDTKIKNDLLLIKLAGVLQKIIAPSGKPGLSGGLGGGILTELLIKQLKLIDKLSYPIKKLILQLSINDITEQFKLDFLNIEKN